MAGSVNQKYWFKYIIYVMHSDKTLLLEQQQQQQQKNIKNQPLDEHVIDNYYET